MKKKDSYYSNMILKENAIGEEKLSYTDLDNLRNELQEKGFVMKFNKERDKLLIYELCIENDGIKYRIKDGSFFSVKILKDSKIEEKEFKRND